MALALDLSLALGGLATSGAPVHPGQLVAQTATHWYDTRTVGNTSQLLANLGTDSAAAVRGSTTGADNNDPLVLPHDGGDYVWMPGTAGNDLTSATTHTVGQGTDPLDVRMDVKSDAGTSHYPIFGGITGGLYLAAGTGVAFFTYDPSYRDAFVTLPVDLQSGTKRRKLRAVATPNGVDTVNVEYFWKPTGSIFDDSGWVSFATNSLPYSGGVWRGTAESLAIAPAPINSIPISSFAAQWKNSTTTVQFDPSESLLGAWTITRSATGLKTTLVTSSVDVFDGSDDYWQLPDSATPTWTATTGEYTAVMLGRWHDDPGGFKRYFSSETSSNIPWAVQTTGSETFYCRAEGSTAPASTSQTTSIPYGDLYVVAGVIDDGTMAVFSDVDGLGSPTSITGIGSFTHQAPRIGAQAFNGASALESETFATLVFDRALSETELDDLSAYLKSVGSLGSSPDPLFVTNAGDLTISRIDTADASDITATWPDGTTSVITSGGSASKTGQPAGAVTFDKANVTRFEVSGPWAFDLSALQRFPLLDYVLLGAGNVTTGDIGGLPSGLTIYINQGSNTDSGDLSDLPSGLTYFDSRGSNTISGDIGDLPSGLTLYYNAGSNTTSGDLSGLPSGLTYYRNQGSNTTSGNLSGLPSGLTYYLNAGLNTTSGGLSGLPSGLTYYNNQGLNTTTGGLSGLPSGLTSYTNTGANTTSGALSGLPSGLTYYNNTGSNTTSGDLSGLPSGLTYYRNEGSNTVNYASGNYGFASMNSTFYQRGTGLSQSEVDEVLADMAAAGLAAVGNKTIDLQGSNAAPSAGASADITILQGNGWTVLTN